MSEMKTSKEVMNTLCEVLHELRAGELDIKEAIIATGLVGKILKNMALMMKTRPELEN